MKNRWIAVFVMTFLIMAMSITTKVTAQSDCGYKTDGKYHCGTNCGYKTDGKYHCGHDCGYKSDGKYHCIGDGLTPN